jgi:hypothetical protein
MVLFMAEKKEYKVDDIKPSSYVIQILDKEFEPIKDTEFEVKLDETSKIKKTDSNGMLKVTKPKSGEITLSL